MTPNKITVHCSASPPGQNLTANDIRIMHKKKGWRDIGYHYVIRRDGSVEKGRKDNVQGAQVSGHNENNLGICLIGGLDKKLKAEANFTDAQYHALYALIMELRIKHKIELSAVCGHRDFFPDANGDGVIDSRDWLKECPCFDVRQWLEKKLLENNEKEGL